MISIYLCGGIGNLMFQIATVEYLGYLYGMDVCYANAKELIPHLEKVCDWTRHAKEYETIFPNWELYKNQDRVAEITRNVSVPFRYKQIIPQNGDNYIGYFQSEKNFPDTDFIRRLFQPSQRILERVSIYDSLFTVDTCSIHIRRGNYLTLQDTHPPLTMGYYQEALSRLRPFKIERYLVFSNDIEWCKQTFIGDEYVFIHDTDYIELFLMARCKYNIIANSSFSWWGAWLGEYYGKIVIAPNTWFGSVFPSDYADDIVPLRWIKI